MNIKEHIEAGHYPLDDKGRALVLAEGGRTAVIYATDHPDGGMVIAGNVRGAPGVRSLCMWQADGRRNFGDRDVPELLSPPPRKVKVTAWGVLTKPFALVHVCRSEKEAREWGCIGQPVIELTGEYEEPWS